MTDFIAIMLGLRSPTLNFGGGGGSGGPTVQQQQLEKQQALTNAQLNVEENDQRKAILNSMMGMRVFRGSALSRAVRGNTPGTGGEQAAPAPSRSQLSASLTPPVAIEQGSLLDQGSGNTSAGGTGASGGATAARGGGYSGAGTPNSGGRGGR